MMGWFYRARDREIATIKKQLARIEQAVASHNQPAGINMDALLENLVNGQVKQLESTGTFIQTINQIAVERAAAALGKRGGQRRAATARRDGRGRMLAARPQSDCRVCNDPNCTDVSIEEFHEHQKHKGRNRAIPTESRRVENENGDSEPVVERAPVEIRNYPLPVVQRPDFDAGSTGGGAPENNDGSPSLNSHEGHIH